MTFRAILARTVLAGALTVSVAAGARAQSAADQQAAPPRPATPAGPMTIERVYNGITIAPDFKLTKVDGHNAQLAGLYGGWMIDNTLLLGGGGYWMTNRTRGLDMQYGGAVVEWLQFANRPIGVSVRGLVGGGTARLTDNFAVVSPVDGDFGFMMDGRYTGMFGAPGRPAPTPPVNVTPYFTFDQGFFVAEPQANVLVNFTRRIRLNVGAGYRFIGMNDHAMDGYDSGLRDRLRGATGSVALEIGVFSK